MHSSFVKSLFCNDIVGRVILEDTICKFPWKFSVEEISMVMEREFKLRNFMSGKLLCMDCLTLKTRIVLELLGNLLRDDFHKPSHTWAM